MDKRDEAELLWWRRFRYRFGHSRNLPRPGRQLWGIRFVLMVKMPKTGELIPWTEWEERHGG